MRPLRLEATFFPVCTFFPTVELLPAGYESILQNACPTLESDSQEFLQGRLLVESLSYVVVGMLDDPICSRVVAADTNVVDVVLLRQMLHSLEERRSIVRHDFRDSAPTTQDVLEDPVAKGLRSLAA